MAFKVFKPVAPTRGRQDKTPALTVNPNGLVTFSQTARKKLKGTYIQAVTDDTQPNLIGLMCTDDPKDSIKMTVDANKDPKGFSGKATLVALGVLTGNKNTDQICRYPLEAVKDGKHDILIFDKSKGENVIPRQRKPK